MSNTIIKRWRKKVYISTSCIQGECIGDVVAAIAERGVNNIELSGGTKYYRNWFSDLAELQEEYQLNYAFHAYFPPTSPDIVINLAAEGTVGDESLEYYLSHLELQKKLGCKTLSIHAGFFIEMTPELIGKTVGPSTISNRNESIGRFVSRYRILENAARQYGIDLLLENNVLSKANYEKQGNNNPFMLVCNDDYLELSSFLEFGLLLDIGHLYVSCNSLGRPFDMELHTLSAKAKWFHFSHNDGISDQHAIIPTSSFVIDALKDLIPYDTPITLESHGKIDEVVECYHRICGYD